ncbi:MAG: SUMF1/EgtB/PvdO family nonheme iron enzyme [Candidatus Brocadiia bacterium]
MANDELGDLALLGDSPILESNREDLLDFDLTAGVLASAAIETADPLTIGILGDWGSGKTSLMRLMMKRLANAKLVAPVWFNAWRFEREEHLIVPLVATIVRELDRPDFEDSVKEGASRIRGALRAIAYGLSIKGRVGIPMFSDAEVNLSPKNMIERYQELTKEAVIGRSLYFDAFQELEKCVKEGHAPRIVVFVDDLDRCFPEQAVDLLESIKLVLHLPGFVFALGMNEKIIRACVKTKYTRAFSRESTKSDGGVSYSMVEPGAELLIEKSCMSYLDKIVQVEIPVPRRETDGMRSYIETLVRQANVIDEQQFADAVPLIADACDHNPRSVVRLLNRAIIAKGIRMREGKLFDPLHLLIQLATEKLGFEQLVRALDVSVIQVDAKTSEPVTIGALISQVLSREHDDLKTLDALRRVKVLSLQDRVDAATSVLDNNSHLLGLLRSEKGRKWLSDPEIRRTMRESSLRTIGESKRESAERPVTQETGQLRSSMVAIVPGVFTMGSEGCGVGAKPHEVELTKPFFIGATQVTQAQYGRVMGVNPSSFRGGDLPVDSVSWHDAMDFCRRLTDSESKKGNLPDGAEYRLPTEAEWEYCCRAGSKTEFCFGDSEKVLGDYAWFGVNSGKKTHPVGTKKPNSWGLYDMHGNVREWCMDKYTEQYRVDDQIDPFVLSSGESRVLRGGSWFRSAGGCRSAERFGEDPGYRNYYNGFRVVLAAPLPLP